MAHDNHPRGLATVHTSQILLQPLVLGIGLCVLDAALDRPKGPAVGDEGLRGRGQLFVTLHVPVEGPLGAIREVGLAVNTNEVGEAIVERIPEITDTACFGTRHIEPVLVGREVSIALLEYIEHGRREISTSAKEGNCSKSG